MLRALPPICLSKIPDSNSATYQAYVYSASATLSDGEAVAVVYNDGTSDITKSESYDATPPNVVSSSDWGALSLGVSWIIVLTTPLFLKLVVRPSKRSRVRMTWVPLQPLEQVTSATSAKAMWILFLVHRALV